MKDSITTEELTLEEVQLLNNVLAELDEALEQYNTEGRTIKTQAGLKRHSVWYKRLVDKRTILSERIDTMKLSQNEAAEALGLPATNETDMTSLSWRKLGGKRDKTLAVIQRELAQHSPALMALLDEAEAQYNDQEVIGGRRTVVVKWNK